MLQKPNLESLLRKPKRTYVYLQIFLLPERFPSRQATILMQLFFPWGNQKLCTNFDTISLPFLEAIMPNF